MNKRGVEIDREDGRKNVTFISTTLNVLAMAPWHREDWFILSLTVSVCHGNSAASPAKFAACRGLQHSAVPYGVLRKPHAPQTPARLVVST